MSHIFFAAAGFLLLIAGVLLAPAPSGAGFDCVLLAVPCFFIALWAPKGGLK